MKRIIAIFLSLLMILSVTPTVFARYVTETQISFDLTSDGAHTVTVPTGAEITVTYSLINKTANESFNVHNITNEIYFDHEFFEIDESSIQSACNENAQVRKKSWGEYRVCINDWHDPQRTYQNGEVVGSFKLKVIASSGQSTLSSKQTTLYLGGKSYQITTEDLTVIVGETPPTLYTVKYIHNESVYKTAQMSGRITIDTIPTPAPQGYEFLGWEYNGQLYQPGDEFDVSSDVTFTSRWKEIIPVVNYTLTFKTNGGTAVPSQTKEEGSVIDLTAFNPTREGYTFEGWYSDAELTQRVTSVKLDANKTVYAKWKEAEKPTYTFTFNTNGGTSIAPLTKEEGSVIDLTKYNPTREGYTFEGWYSDAALTQRITSVKLTKDTVIYAKWSKINDTPESDEQPYHPEMLTKEHYAYIVGRKGNKIEPMANITRAEVATIFFRLLTEEVRNANITTLNSFEDVNKGDWFNTAVSTLARLGIIKGRSESSFAPNEKITRAEFTAMVVRFSDIVWNGYDLFSDIDGHWARDYINAAASIGWVVGNNGKFRPDDNITRAEAMTLVNRVLNRVPESEADLLSAMIRFEDNADPNAWYYLAVQEATNSHRYEIKSDGVHERWTELTENPNWADFEK